MAVDEKAKKGSDSGSSLEVYQQPVEFKSSHILGLLGIPSDGVAEDFVFATTQKVLLLFFAAIMYWLYVVPLMVAKGAPATRSKAKRP